ncbi:ABC transporter permease [Companilactobacillus kimchiensis]|uniref:Uncharacterized protein n=1 Tax=Companilactobacillus kimchiensis TaxID=993692 RepID=A0A0R2LMG1_9LACO|nr:ABC transporter permease [Companilactobacillus kimchiensis]KRO00576.1 hypothetical protein IV57_GL001012 [Companilactobacillus kimchiensis]
MLNQLRTDFYRLSHTWGIYITFACTILYAAMIVINNVVGGIMVTGDSMAKLNSNDIWTLKNGLNAATLSSSLLVYLFIGIFVITIGYEFSQKTYKNTLVSGITRSQFIISKYLVMLINIFLLTLIYFITSIVSGLICNRSVGTSWSNLLSQTINNSIVIAFFISIVFGIAILVLLLTSSNVAGSIFIVVFPVIISVLNNIANWTWLKYIDFFSAAMKISLKLVTNGQLWNYVIVSFVVLLATIITSTIVIKNKEL